MAARAAYDLEPTAAELEAARRLVGDTLACAVAGSADPVVAGLGSTVPDQPGGVRMPGSGRTVSAGDAQLLLSASIRALDLNDIFSARNNHHPSEIAIPPVLAQAALEDMSIGHLLDGVVRAYRVSLGVGELWSGLLRTGWAPTATLGRISGALIGSFLRGASAEQAVHAAAIGAVTAPTLGVVFRGQLSSAKSLVNGMAARAAWEAAAMASAGLTGPLDALEGEGGFERMIGSHRLDSLPSVGVLDVSLKAYPTVFTAHAAIAAAIELAGTVTLDEVASIEIGVPDAVANMAAPASKWTITTREEAQFSLPVTVAIALIAGGCSLGDIERAIEQPAQATATLARMRVLSDPDADGYEGGWVRLTLRDGSTRIARRATPPGHPQTPLSADEIRTKVRDLTGPVLGESAADRVLRLLEDEHASTRQLLDATTLS
jgi:2-methylcitrate dehydratase PrpD